MSKDLLLRVPTSLVSPWLEIRQEIARKLGSRLGIPLEDIKTAVVFQEVVRILWDHIFVGGYPEPGAVQEAKTRTAMQLRQLRDAVAENERLRSLLSPPAG